MDRWADRVAVVTGASSGIGQTLAKELSIHGMKVAALARRFDRLQKLQDESKDYKGVMKIYKCDISNENEIVSTLGCIVKDLGPISVLVNCAAILSPMLITDINSGSCRKLYETNVISVVTLLQNIVEIMRKNGITDGHIININGRGGNELLPNLDFGNYCATKEACKVFTDSLRLELATMKSGIRVTSISPSLTETEMSSDFAKAHPSLSTNDIAECLLYALSVRPHVNITEISVIPVENQDILTDHGRICNMEGWRGGVAIVTGASSGIGESVARELARHGMKVAALARRLDRLQKLQENCANFKGVLKPYKCDVSDESEIISTVKLIATELGPISVLVNNAAILTEISLTSTDNMSCRKLYETNSIGLVTMTQNVFNVMKENNIFDGHIININSINGNTSFHKPGLVAYCASKNIVTILTKSLLKEVEAFKFKTRVTSISPGLVSTEMIGKLIITSDIPRLLPEDVADSIIFTLSIKSKVNISELRIQPVGEIPGAFAKI